MSGAEADFRFIYDQYTYEAPNYVFNLCKCGALGDCWFEISGLVRPDIPPSESIESCHAYKQFVEEKNISVGRCGYPPVPRVVTNEVSPAGIQIYNFTQGFWEYRPWRFVVRNMDCKETAGGLPGGIANTTDWATAMGNGKKPLCVEPGTRMTSWSDLRNLKSIPWNINATFQQAGCVMSCGQLPSHWEVDDPDAPTDPFESYTPNPTPPPSPPSSPPPTPLSCDDCKHYACVLTWKRSGDQQCSNECNASPTYFNVTHCSHRRTSEALPSSSHEEETEEEDYWACKREEWNNNANYPDADWRKLWGICLGDATMVKRLCKQRIKTNPIASVNNSSNFKGNDFSECYFKIAWADRGTGGLTEPSAERLDYQITDMGCPTLAADGKAFLPPNVWENWWAQFITNAANFRTIVERQNLINDPLMQYPPWFKTPPHVPETSSQNWSAYGLPTGWTPLLRTNVTGRSWEDHATFHVNPNCGYRLDKKPDYVPPQCTGTYADFVSGVRTGSSRFNTNCTYKFQQNSTCPDKNCGFWLTDKHVYFPSFVGDNSPPVTSCSVALNSPTKTADNKNRSWFWELFPDATPFPYVRETLCTPRRMCEEDYASLPGKFGKHGNLGTSRPMCFANPPLTADCSVRCSELQESWNTLELLYPPLPPPLPPSPPSLPPHPPLHPLPKKTECGISRGDHRLKEQLKWYIECGGEIVGGGCRGREYPAVASYLNHFNESSQAVRITPLKEGQNRIVSSKITFNGTTQGSLSFKMRSNIHKVFRDQPVGINMAVYAISPYYGHKIDHDHNTPLGPLNEKMYIYCDQPGNADKRQPQTTSGGMCPELDFCEMNGPGLVQNTLHFPTLGGKCGDDFSGAGGSCDLHYRFGEYYEYWNTTDKVPLAFGWSSADAEQGLSRRRALSAAATEAPTGSPSARYGGMHMDQLEVGWPIPPGRCNNNTGSSGCPRSANITNFTNIEELAYAHCFDFGASDMQYKTKISQSPFGNEEGVVEIATMDFKEALNKLQIDSGSTFTEWNTTLTSKGIHLVVSFNQAYLPCAPPSKQDSSRVEDIIFEVYDIELFGATIDDAPMQNHCFLKNDSNTETRCYNDDGTPNDDAWIDQNRPQCKMGIGEVCDPSKTSRIADCTSPCWPLKKNFTFDYDSRPVGP